MLRHISVNGVRKNAWESLRLALVHLPVHRLWFLETPPFSNERLRGRQTLEIGTGILPLPFDAQSEVHTAPAFDNGFEKHSGNARTMKVKSSSPTNGAISLYLTLEKLMSMPSSTEGI